MRTLLKLSLLPAAMCAVLLAACGKATSRSDSGMSDDLKRDLQLASSSGLDLASKQSGAAFPLTEIPVSSAPTPSPTLKKGSGPKAIRSRTPTVKATPEPSIVANAEEPEVEVTSPAPSPVTERVPDPEAPAVPRPSPINPAPDGDGSFGRGGSGPRDGGSTGSVLGGIFGVIIRGGGVDGDRCEIHGRGRGRNAPQTPYPGTGRTTFPGRPPGTIMSRNRG